MRNNRLNYPLNHPESIRKCLLLFGANDFEFTNSGPVKERLSAFEEVQERLTNLGKTENFELIPIHVNARLLCPSYECWTAVGLGAANVAVAHAFDQCFSKVLFASDGEGVNHKPTAGHPLLINYFSSTTLQVQMEEIHLTRTEKLDILTDWETGLNIMQPCHKIKILPKGQINCGHCEKCVRTMLTLLCLGKLAQTKAFPDDDVTPEMIN